ncbi:FGGY-family carbohydrate kinase [Nonomuraea roseoviolacea]|uniref:Sugar (Pentulose or hexulose) kinase n=1 Tax=Nonomuraea roseoviolacea subsp. carminata TaxID=160689 RepID=A0ABT1KHF6_9ACTN|nr:FGGY family carbohydrate kinase [Nonomuraea roseoviolacea]MCP2352414.1 sugar (pentulose or hexulose) kinase [Nonomuraea roseoviolacea subsp. carminata]
MRTLAGVDVGTTHVKVGFHDENGRCPAEFRRPTPRELPALVAAVREGLAACAARTGRRPDAIGVTGMAETGVPLDAEGRPLTPFLWWTDPRGADEAAGLARDAVRLFEVTGHRATAKTPLAKWLWLRRHEPAVLDRMRWWAGAPDAVAHALTGTLRTHETLAARTLAYDVGRHAYDPDLLALAGLTPEVLPPVAGAVEPVGGAVPGLDGVTPGTPVVIAGHDHMVGCWAAGVRRPGDAGDSLGTAEAVMVPAAAPPDPRTGLALGVTADPSLDGRHVVLVGGLSSSGALLDWLLDLLTPVLDSASLRDPALPPGPGSSSTPGSGSASRSGSAAGDRYAVLPRLLDGVRLPTGIVAEPYLRGRAAPAPDPGRRLTLAGLDAAHGAGDLLAAAVEGTCLHTRWTLAELTAVAGVAAERLVVFGGQVRIPLWMLVKAAVSVPPVEVVRAGDAVCAGAALVAGQAGGSLDDVPVLPREAEPRDPALAAAYDTVYERFLAAARTAGPPGLAEATG